VKKCVYFLLEEAKKAQGHGMDKTPNSRRSGRIFYVPKCVESMLGNFLEKHDINLPIHLKLL
jgi:hypothetical protein